jgi:hypothetical protein
MAKREKKTQQPSTLATRKKDKGDPSIDDQRVGALSKAIQHITGDEQNVLVDLLLQQYPNYLHGWFHKTFDISDDMSYFLHLCSKLDEFRKKHPSPKQFGFQASMYGDACELCADEFMKMDLPQKALIFYQGAIDARPERRSELAWRMATALIRQEELDQAEELLSSAYEPQDSSLFVFATRGLLQIVRDKGSEFAKATRLAFYGALHQRNEYLYECLIGARSFPGPAKKLPRTLKPGSRSEVVWYLQLAIPTWAESDALGEIDLNLPDDFDSDQLLPAPVIDASAKHAPAIAEIRSVIDSTNFSDPIIRHRLDVVKTPVLWSAFLPLARQWYEAQVWKTVGEEMPFEITTTDARHQPENKAPRVVSTMGALGECFGVHVFDTRADALRYMQDTPVAKVVHDRDVGLFRSVTFEFVPITELLEESRCLLSAFRFEPIGPRKLVPDIRRYYTGYSPTLPDELSLIDLSHAVALSLELHKAIISGDNPWKKGNGEQTLGLYASLPPSIAELVSSASRSDYPPAPDFDGARFNRMDLTKALGRVRGSNEEWDVSWTYLPSWISGSKSYPDFRACIAVLANRGSGELLAHTDLVPGDVLVKSIVNLLLDVVKTLRYRPRRIYFDEHIDIGTLGPVLKSVGVDAVNQLLPDSAARALDDLCTRLRGRPRDLAG